MYMHYVRLCVPGCVSMCVHVVLEIMVRHQITYFQPSLHLSNWFWLGIINGFDYVSDQNHFKQYVLAYLAVYFKYCATLEYTCVRCIYKF